MVLLQNCSNLSKLLSVSHDPVSKFFSFLNNFIFQLPCVLHLCKLFCNLGFTSQCLDCSGRNTNQVFDLRNLSRKTFMLSYGVAVNFHEIKAKSRVPFFSLVWKRDCHINYKVLVKDLRANENAVLWEPLVTSSAGSACFQWSVEVFMRNRPPCSHRTTEKFVHLLSSKGKANLWLSIIYLHEQLKNEYS